MYIENSTWIDMSITPLEGETFLAFHQRVFPALTALCPYDDANAVDMAVVNLWSNHVMEFSDEMIVHLKREKHTYEGYSYKETWWGNWKVANVFAAAKDGVENPEMATAGSGEAFKITKTKTEEQLVFGWANVAIDENGNYPVDWDGDFTDPSDLEKAAYQFVLKYRVTGENHEGEAVGDLVESVMLTKEKQQAMGIPEGNVPEGWWVGFHISDTEVFKKIKSGEYEMFSVEGSALRKPAQ